MEQKECKFEIQDMLPIGLTFVVLGIGLTYGLSVMSDVKDGMTSCPSGYGWNTSANLCSNSTNASSSYQSAEYNASEDAIEGVAKIPEKMPLIATVIVAAIIIGILVRYLMVRFA